MSRKDDVKFIADINTEETDIAVRPPFELMTENRRRFIRIEIASPMSLQKIKETGGDFLSDVDWRLINGSILNISAGGVLVDADQIVYEGDIVSMTFTLQGSETLDHVLGLVKRVEPDEGNFLAGIEFISTERLNDIFSSGEIEMLPDQMTDFNHGVRDVISKYVYRETTNA